MTCNGSITARSAASPASQPALVARAARSAKGGAKRLVDSSKTSLHSGPQGPRYLTPTLHTRACIRSLVVAICTPPPRRTHFHGASRRCDEERGRKKEESKSKNKTGPLVLGRSQALEMISSDVSEFPSGLFPKLFVLPPNGRKFQYKRPTRLSR